MKKKHEVQHRILLGVAEIRFKNIVCILRTEKTNLSQICFTFTKRVEV